MSNSTFTQSSAWNTPSRTSTVTMDAPKQGLPATALQVVDVLHRAEYLNPFMLNANLSPNQKLPLPSVAVMGGQSSGKSSL